MNGFPGQCLANLTDRNTMDNFDLYIYEQYRLFQNEAMHCKHIIKMPRDK